MPDIPKHHSNKHTIWSFLEYVDQSDSKDPDFFWGRIYSFTAGVSIIIGGGIPLLCLVLKIPLQFNQDSARYLLSSIIQSQAAIIAIVISLTLIAVQFTATAYSPRSVEVFKKHPALWSIIIMYIISMGISSILLLSIADDISYNTPVSMFFYLFSVTFFICLIGVLIPHIRVTMNHLNANNIVTQLISQIPVDFDQSLDTDPFQSTFDVINSAIKKDDFSTAVTGIDAVCEKYEKIVSNKHSAYDRTVLSFLFMSNLQKCGLLSIEKNGNAILSIIIENLKKLYKKCIHRSDPIIAIHSVKTVNNLCLKIIPEGNDYLVNDTFSFFNEVYKETKKPDSFLRESLFLPQFFEDIAIQSIKHKKIQYAKSSVQYLSKIIDENGEHQTGIGQVAVDCLEKIVEISIENNDETTKNYAINCLYMNLDKGKISSFSLYGYIDWIIRSLQSKYGKRIPDKKSH